MKGRPPGRAPRFAGLPGGSAQNVARLPHARKPGVRDPRQTRAYGRPMSAAGEPVVMVTRAAKRVGRGIALDFASRGWAVGVHFRNSEAAAHELVAQIRAEGGRAVASVPIWPARTKSNGSCPRPPPRWGRSAAWSTTPRYSSATAGPTPRGHRGTCTWRAICATRSRRSSTSPDS